MVEKALSNYIDSKSVSDRMKNYIKMRLISGRELDKSTNFWLCTKGHQLLIRCWGRHCLARRKKGNRGETLPQGRERHQRNPIKFKSSSSNCADITYTRFCQLNCKFYNKWSSIKHECPLTYSIWSYYIDQSLSWGIHEDWHLAWKIT